MTKVVIDTNVLVASLSSKSIYHWLVVAILNEQIDIYVTDDILFEYDEILSRKYAPIVANNFLTALKELPPSRSVSLRLNFCKRLACEKKMWIS